MWELRCESWTIKKTEHQRINTFELFWLEKILESSLDSKEIKLVSPKGNQSWLFIGRTDAEAETPLLWSLIRRTDSLEKTLILGKVKGRRKSGQQRMASVTQWTWVWTDSGRRWKTGKPGMLQSMESQRIGYDWVTEQQQQHKKLTYVILEVEKSSRSTLLAGDQEELMGVSSILEAGVFRIQEESIFLFESKERKILVFHLK